MVFLFDGIGAVNVQHRPNRINARHNNKTITNLVMFDGHAESIRTEDLPGGYIAAGSMTAAALIGKPAPLWRLDQ